MLLFELVRYIDDNGIGVRLVDGKLSITGDQALLTGDVVAALRAHKQALGGYYGARDAEIVPVAAARAPLSFAQRRLYFLYQYDPAQTHFILPAELELRGTLDPERFCRALAAVVHRHPIYRTTYAVDADGVPWQYIAHDREFAVDRRDATTLDDAAGQQLLDTLRDAIGRRPYDLHRELPVRACLVRHADDLHTLLLSFHHIATDEWSSQQFLAETAARYRDLCAGIDALPPPPTVGYADYATWQVQRYEAGAYAVSRAYWQHALEGSRGVLELPLDRPRPPVQTHGAGAVALNMPPALAAQAAAFAGRRGLPDFSFHLAVFQLLLHKLTLEDDIVVGTDVFGRDHEQLREMAGFFVNQLALRCRVRPDQAVEDFLRDANAAALAALRHQDMPFDMLVDGLGIERDAAYPPVFQVKFLYERAAQALDAFEGLSLRARDTFAGNAQYDLTLKVTGAAVTAYFNADLLDAATVRRWVELYFALLADVVERPAAAVADLLQPRLQHDLHALTDGVRVDVAAGSLFARFQQAVDAHPQAIAVRTETDAVTYAALDARITRIAARLLALRIGRGVKVGVFLERSLDMVAAILATMRVGGVLVPLDTGYPAEHIEYTLADSGAAVVITDAALADALPAYYGVVLDVDAIAADPLPRAALDYPALAGADIAYLLYTSGSTGRPKGALISHGGFGNLCDWYIGYAGLTADSRVLLMIPIGFDASIKNIYAPLMVGGTLVLARPDRFDPASLLAQIEHTEVSLINCAPSAAYALVAQAAGGGFRALRSLDMLALGGEALDPAQLAPWLRSEACRATVANIYGPTECTDISVAFRATAAEWLRRGHVAIGRPIQNVQAYVVDGSLRLCPRGVAGELLIAGHGVGAGYHNLPEATQASFVVAPWSGERAYRTGDYCRYDADGELVYLGRRDGQIKIRGKRVEVDEIVHRIGALLPGRAISVQPHGDAGAELLVAFIGGGAAPLAPRQLKAQLGRQLPRHMVPAHYVFVDALPLTANGKVCRRSLLALFEQQRVEQSSAEAAFDPTEQLIASVWEQLLHVPVTEKDADFFSLGGDSIFSIQLVAELRRHGIEVTVADVFKHPGLAALAEFAGQARVTPAAPVASTPAFALLTDADRARLPDGLEDAYPVTALQAGMLLHAQLDTQGSTYHDVFSYELAFDFDEPTFRRAISHVVALHPVLRTGFDFGRYSEPLQLVHRDVEPQIHYVDVSDRDAAAQADLIAERIRAVKAERYASDARSLVRFSILRLAADRIQCIVDAHHAILDGWSMAIVQRQIFDCYRHYKYGTPLGTTFDHGWLRYADYVAQARAAADDPAAQAHWDACAAALDGMPMLAVQPGEPVFDAHTFALAPRLVERLAAVVAGEQVALKTLLLMAHGWVLQTLTGRARNVTGVTDSGRPEEQGAENLVGLFLNVLPVDVDLRATTWRGFAAALNAADVAAKPHRRYPFAAIARRHPRLAVDANFTYTNFRVSSKLTREDWLQVRTVELFEQTDFRFATHVSGSADDGISVTLSSTLNLSPAYFDRLQQQFVFALDAIAERFDAAIPAPPLHALPLCACADGERSAVLLSHAGALDIPALQDAAAQILQRIAADTGAPLRDVEPLHVAVLPASDDAAAAVQQRLQHGATAFAVAACRAGDRQWVAVRVDAARGEQASRLAQFVERYLAFNPAAVDVEAGDGSGRMQPVAVLDRAAAFWRAQLADLPAPLELPADRTRTAKTVIDASVPFAMAADASAALRQRAHQLAVPLDALLLAAWSVLLARSTGEYDQVVGMRGRPVRLQLQPGQRFADVATAVAAALRAIDQHAAIPAAQLADLLSLRAPLFSAAFDDPGTVPAGEIRLMLRDATVLEGSLDYAQALFDAQTIARCAGHLQTLLHAIAADADVPVDALPLLGADERRCVLDGFNATAQPHDTAAVIHELFERQVRAQPDAIALYCGDRSLSYAELNARANRLAHRLLALGVRPDARVAVCMQRSETLVVALLGVLKAGGAYVPLDPAYPPERLRYMLDDSAPAVVLTDAALHARHGTRSTRPVVCVDDGADAALPAHDPDPSALGLTPAHLAYVIYTSGSTGQPKGVAIEHRNTVNLVEWALASFAREQLANTLFATSINFDLAVYELFVPLAAGTAVSLVTDVLSAGAARHAPSLINTVPSGIAALVAAGRVPAATHAINLAGEPLKRALVERIFATTSAQTVCNLYGPTETTTYSTWTRFDRAHGFEAHIGRPVANTRVYVLDARRQPVPIGVAGELYIGGAGVARGYLGRPELTAERFVDDPFAGMPGARMYRTGDIGRWRADGMLEYIGRNDFQVKIRGYRIELGEIETKLAQQPGVADAVVVAREDAAGDRRLVAYVVPQAGAELSVASLRAALARELADYMVPSAIVRLAALPLTPNGKLDRSALPAPERDASAARAFRAPAGDAEVALARIWQELLGVEQIGRDDHFFELGGHSLLVMRLATRVREQFHVDVPVATLFERPVLAAFADAVDALQQQTFLGGDLARMEAELDGLSDAELQALLDREAVHD